MLAAHSAITLLIYDGLYICSMCRMVLVGMGFGQIVAAVIRGQRPEVPAQCIADNKTNCDCFIKCQLTGSCT